MKSSFRWYGDSDPVTLDKIRQIPGMRSIVSAVYDVKPVSYTHLTLPTSFTVKLVGSVRCV